MPSFSKLCKWMNKYNQEEQSLLDVFEADEFELEYYQ
jgi:hypothetical protein